jgi:hypothetical protein
MRLIAYLAAMAACSIVLTARCPAMSAEEDAAASTPEKQSDAVEPVQVLLEATIIRVESYKEPRAETVSSILDRILNAPSAEKQGPASTAYSSNGSPKQIAGEINPFGVAFIDGGGVEFTRAVESLAEVKVLANPRLLILDKQRAEIHLGNSCMRVRPYVLSDGTIRLETHVKCSTTEDPNTVTTTQITSNLIVPNGNTAIIGTLTDVETTTTDKSPSANSMAKKELLITLTPRPWKPGSPLAASVSHPGDFTKRMAEAAHSQNN